MSAKETALISLTKDTQFWPAGLIYLATYIHTKSQHRVKIIDKNVTDDVVKQTEGFKLIGISAMSAQYEEASQLARQIKAQSDATVIIGGVHVSTCPESMRDCFDLAIPGEAEEKLLDYLNGEYSPSKPYQRLRLDNYPQLDYSLLDKSYFKPRYLGNWCEMGVEGTLLTSRGCPFRCPFCSTTKFWVGKNVRMFSVDWIINELKSQASRGVTHVTIWDDLFACSKDRLKKIRDRLKAEGLAFKFSGTCRASIMDDEIGELLHQLGFRMLNFGFESGNPRVLNWLKSGTTTVEDNDRALKLCKKHGIKASGSLIFTPGETFSENLDTVKFTWRAFKNGAASIWWYPLTPLPGTEVWEHAKQQGRVSANMNFDQLKYYDGFYSPVRKRTKFLMFCLRLLLRLRRQFHL
jgi:radical SAM superfamily enzyme YgiQ (UPF0313 family)